uniref:prothymosin alpha-like n=1 Tax=Arvicanthis niloticus TaxID=61156 RepID=UPI001485CE3D|nr:prothymosin alpha-like [Arvicanthis niloticus]
MSDASVDTSSKITTKDLKEKKEVVEEAENGRTAPANGNAQSEKNGEQEADNEVDEQAEEGGEEEEDEEEEVIVRKRMEMMVRKLRLLQVSG